MTRSCASTTPRIDARALDWGDAAEIGPLRVTLEPALHWSARGRSDRRMALWGSFMIAGARRSDLFRRRHRLWRRLAVPARSRRGISRIRLALLPIGAYAPRWFMRDQHCDPDEASGDLPARSGAERAVACHWGTFRLTDEPYDEPPRRLAEALAREGIAAERFVAPAAGGVVEIG